jgi:hypothetical protein
MIKKTLTALAISGLTLSSASAVLVTSGSTTVGLNTTVLSGAGINVTGATATGTATTTGFATGLTSVPFSISSATTFNYDPATFPGAGSFSGAIEHTGDVSLSIDFNTDDMNAATNVTLGNFTIGYDGARATGGNSGFFVRDNVDLDIIIFDLAFLSTAAGGTSVTAVTSTATDLNIGPVNVRVSPELNTIFQSLPSGANVNLTGADVGDARIDAVPEPTTLSAALLGLGLLGRRRRRA